MSKHLTEWTTTLAMPLDMLALIDAWRAKQPDLPNRREAMRRLIKAGLLAPDLSKWEMLP